MLDRYGHHVAFGRAVARRVAEAVHAVKVGVGRVGERAVGVKGQSSVGRAGHQRGRERIAVDVGVVAQHTRGGNRQQCVFSSRKVVIFGMA